MGLTPLITASRLARDTPLTSAYPAEDVLCEGLFGYWAGLDRVWDTGRTIVNVEHDMEFSDDLVAELLSCPRELCAYPYEVRPSGMPERVYSVSYFGWGTDDSIPFAIFSAIGFCKIAATAQVGTKLTKTTWMRVERVIHDAVITDQRLWHIHWPAIGHRHDYEAEGDPEGGSLLNEINKARAEGRLTVHGPDPSEERLRACDPLLYDESVRDRAPALHGH